jgi:uncharacterized membrane protein YidH (DUF202 family)
MDPFILIGIVIIVILGFVFDANFRFNKFEPIVRRKFFRSGVLSIIAIILGVLIYLISGVK